MNPKNHHTGMLQNALSGSERQLCDLPSIFSIVKTVEMVEFLVDWVAAQQTLCRYLPE